MDSFSRRLRMALEMNNLTQAELCEKTKIPKSAISQYLSGEFKPKQNRTHLIAKTLNVSEAWLMGYDVDIKRADTDITDDIINAYDNILPITTKRIPLLGEIACGEPIYANEEHEYFVDASTDIQADFALRAKGDSMINARINDGDIVFIRKQEDVDDGEIAAVIIDDEVTLKRVYKQIDGVMLVAENPKYKPFVYTSHDSVTINILGKAVAFQSDL